jgi:hypothetical protein
MLTAETLGLRRVNHEIRQIRQNISGLAATFGSKLCCNALTHSGFDIHINWTLSVKVQIVDGKIKVPTIMFYSYSREHISSSNVCVPYYTGRGEIVKRIFQAA